MELGHDDPYAGIVNSETRVEQNAIIHGGGLMAAPKKNTGKAPSVQFYYKDFLADLLEHPVEIVGAWFLILTKIWHAKSNGEITRSLTQFALIMHVTESRAKEFLDYIKLEDIGDVTYVTDDNAQITVVNRRTKRDSKLLEQNRLRQQAYREKQESNGGVAGEKGNPSTSTSNSTPTSLLEIDKKNSPESGGLGLNKELKIRAMLFGEELDAVFPRISRDEATTFLRIAQHLSEEVLLGAPITIFDNALSWAKESMSSNARNPKGLFVAKVKEQTGFTGRGLLLDRK